MSVSWMVAGTVSRGARPLVSATQRASSSRKKGLPSARAAMVSAHGTLRAPTLAYGRRLDKPHALGLESPARGISSRRTSQATPADSRSGKRRPAIARAAGSRPPRRRGTPPTAGRSSGGPRRTRPGDAAGSTESATARAVHESGPGRCPPEAPSDARTLPPFPAAGGDRAPPRPDPARLPRARPSPCECRVGAIELGDPK